MTQEDSKEAAPVDATKTPEFSAAVAKAVAEAVPAAIAEALKAASFSGEIGDQDTTRFMLREMAMAIAEISDQGTGRRRVAPEILARRAAAHDRMQKLRGEILSAYRARAAETSKEKAAAEGYLPKYRAIAMSVLNERVIQPFVRVDGRSDPKPNYVFWGGIPNLAMRPANEAARQIFELYRESIGSTEKGAKVGQGCERVEDFWITTGGNIMRGPKPEAQRFAHEARELGIQDGDLPSIDDQFADELGIPQGNDPLAKTVNVLGTIAEPAKMLNLGSLPQGH